MKKQTLLLSLVAVLAVLGVIFSCTPDASSGVNFVFTKAPKQGTVMKILGKEINALDLFAGSENELFEAEMKLYELKMHKIRARVLKELMEADPRKKGLSNDAFVEKYLLKGTKVSTTEVNKFIKEKNISQKMINAQMKGRIKEYLMTQKKKEVLDAWMAEKTKNNPVEVYINKPVRPVFDINVGTAPFIGKSDAKVTIVEFTDFQCPFCAKGGEVIKQLKKKYGKKIKVVFKNFPLPFHSLAKIAANAAHCAGEQKGSYFWEMHDKMFADQSKLGKSDLKELVKSLKDIDFNKFEDCLETKKYFDYIEQDMEQGKKLGVNSTPTFFVNGQLIQGALPIETFSEIIDQELER